MENSICIQYPTALFIDCALVLFVQDNLRISLHVIKRKRFESNYARWSFKNFPKIYSIIMNCLLCLLLLLYVFVT